MSVKGASTALAALAVVALLVSVWHRPAALQLAASKLWSDHAAEVEPSSNPAAAVRRCSGGAGVIYTDGACPPGTRERALGGGGLTVLPTPVARAPRLMSSERTASAPNARQLLLSTDGADLKAQRIERVIAP